VIFRRGTSWVVQVYVGVDPVTGAKKYKSRSVPGTLSQKVAPKAARDLETALKAEAAKGSLTTSTATVDELLVVWLAQASPNLSPWTLRGYEGSIRRYLSPAFGHVKVSALTVVRIDALYTEMQVQGLAPATIRQTHAVLRKALDRARRWGWINRNPAEDASPPKIVPKRLDPPSRAEIAQLKMAADQDLADLILLAEQTGARRGELCGLRWVDVDMASGRLRITRSIVDLGHGQILVKSPKTGKARSLIVGPTALEMLRQRRLRAQQVAMAFGTQLAADAYILSENPDGTEPLKPTLVTGRFAGLTRRLGITCRFHDLRHANATELLAAGIPVVDVAQRLGHASAKMTLDVYAHPSENRAAALVFETGPALQAPKAI